MIRVLSTATSGYVCFSVATVASRNARKRLPSLEHVSGRARIRMRIRKYLTRAIESARVILVVGRETGFGRVEVSRSARRIYLLLIARRHRRA